MTVQTSAGAYEIVRIALQHLPAQIPNDSFLITDKIVAAKYPTLVRSAKHSLVLESGEESKSLAVFGDCLSWLASVGASRGSRVVALGGGVIGDLAGFVASAYMRGVPYIQVPTTLLAQVDSSVGGKVGIDLPEGKNLAGAFHPPARVLLSSEIIDDLPERQIRNGLAEVIKYGFIYDPDLLAATASFPRIEFSRIVDRCVEIKAEIVEKDEFETNGIRATLNFGHTIGHAIETVLNYKELLHGEAVSIGMVVEARMGESLGLSKEGTAEQVERHLAAVGLPTSHPVLTEGDALIAAMYRDKKSVEGKLAFSLLEQIGTCKLIAGVAEESVRSALGC